MSHISGSGGNFELLICITSCAHPYRQRDCRVQQLTNGLRSFVHLGCGQSWIMLHAMFGK